MNYSSLHEWAFAAAAARREGREIPPPPEPSGGTGGAIDSADQSQPQPRRPAPEAPTQEASSSAMRTDNSNATQDLSRRSMTKSQKKKLRGGGFLQTTILAAFAFLGGSVEVTRSAVYSSFGVPASQDIGTEYPMFTWQPSEGPRAFFQLLEDKKPGLVFVQPNAEVGLVGNRYRSLFGRVLMYQGDRGRVAWCQAPLDEGPDSSGCA